MKTVIMLVGQGGIGKSTYAHWLHKNIKNSAVVAMDDIVKQDRFIQEQHWPIYMQRIEEQLFSSCDVVILDYAHDCHKARVDVIQNLISTNEVSHLIILHLRPPIDFLMEHYFARGNTHNHTQEDICHFYDNCKFLPHEFENLPFNVDVLTVDNSRGYIDPIQYLKGTKI